MASMIKRDNKFFMLFLAIKAVNGFSSSTHYLYSTGRILVMLCSEYHSFMHGDTTLLLTRLVKLLSPNFWRRNLELASVVWFVAVLFVVFVVVVCCLFITRL